MLEICQGDTVSKILKCFGTCNLGAMISSLSVLKLVGGVFFAYCSMILPGGAHLRLNWSELGFFEPWQFLQYGEPKNKAPTSDGLYHPWERFIYWACHIIYFFTVTCDLSAPSMTEEFTSDIFLIGLGLVAVILSIIS